MHQICKCLFECSNSGSHRSTIAPKITSRPGFCGHMPPTKTAHPDPVFFFFLHSFFFGKSPSVDGRFRILQLRLARGQVALTSEYRPWLDACSKFSPARTPEGRAERGAGRAEPEVLPERGTGGSSHPARSAAGRRPASKRATFATPSRPLASP